MAEKTRISSRLNYIDQLRGIAILLVILGHYLIALTPERFAHPVVQIIYTFHMPIFMLISGYLMGFSHKKLFLGFVDKIRTVVLPTMTFSVLLLWNVPFRLSFLNPFTTWFYWFLWSNLICYLLFRLIKEINVKYLLPISFVAMYFIPDTIIISAHKFMYQMFLVGYWVNDNNLIEYAQKHEKHLMWIATIFFILLLPLYNRETYIYNTPFCILNDNCLKIVLIDFFRFLIAILGSIVFVICMRYIRRILKVDSFVARFVVFAGVNSIGFYGFQFLFFSIIHRFVWPLHLDIWTSTSITFVILLTCCSLATIICKQYKILNIIFLGGR